MREDTTPVGGVLGAVGDALRTAYDRLAGDKERPAEEASPSPAEDGGPERAAAPFGPNRDRETWVERFRERVDGGEPEAPDNGPDGETR